MSSNINRRVVQLRKASTLEERAHQLRLSIWNNQYDLFSGRPPENYMDLLEPGVALHMLGFRVVTENDLGEMFEEGRRVRVAGLIDTEQKTVRISAALDYKEMRFTTGHELAHAELHPDMSGLHRDRALSGPLPRKNKVEVDADRFTSAFLMSPRLVLREFEKRFCGEVFRLNEDSIFGLSLGSARQRIRSTRDVSYTVAQAVMYMGRNFESLSTVFRVSPTTMAIRLEELGLIEEFHSPQMW
jgi:IrrE N-terminal-like domain